MQTSLLDHALLPEGLARRTLTTSASTTIILLRQGALAVSSHELRAVLNPRDSLMAGAGCSSEIQPAGAQPDAFFLIELRPA
jgi:hypothetical protein